MTGYGSDLATDEGLCRGVAKLVKAPDFDSGMRRFESFFPCHITLVICNMRPATASALTLPPLTLQVNTGRHWLFKLV